MRILIYPYFDLHYKKKKIVSEFNPILEEENLQLNALTLVHSLIKMNFSELEFYLRFHH